MKGTINKSAKVPYNITVHSILNALKDIEDRIQGFDDLGVPLDVGISRITLSSYISSLAEHTIPKRVPQLVKNELQMGYPDLLRSGRHKNPSVGYSSQGIEVKTTSVSGLRIMATSAVKSWVLVIKYEVNPFRFTEVYLARLDESCYTWYQRKNSTSKYAINKRGIKKFRDNWLWKRGG